MVDRNRWGDGKARFLFVVHEEADASPDGWCHLGYRQLALRARLAPRWAYELVHGAKRRSEGRLVASGGLLTARGHVLVVGEHGSGSRGLALRVNPHVWEWRGVPWAVPAGELEARLAQLRRSCVMHTAALALRRDALVPRSLTAALDMLTELSEGPKRPSHRGASAAVRRPRKTSSAAVLNRGTNFAPRAPYTMPLERVKTLSLPKGESEGAFVSTQRPERPAARVLVALQRAMGGQCHGTPRQALLEHLAAHPDRAEALERQAETMGGWRTFKAAVPALIAWDDDHRAAQTPVVIEGQDEELGGDDEGPQGDPADWDEMARNVNQIRRSFFGPRGDVDTGTWQDEPHGNSRTAQA